MRENGKTYLALIEYLNENKEPFRNGFLVVNTQREMADKLGVTVVMVNRILQDLTEKKKIRKLTTSGKQGIYYFEHLE